MAVSPGTSGESLPGRFSRGHVAQPEPQGLDISFSFLSQNGVSHVVEYKLDLGAVGWTLLETIPGDGILKTVTRMNRPDDTMSCRVNSQKNVAWPRLAGHF